MTKISNIDVVFLCLLWQMRGKIRKCPELRHHFSMEGYVSHLTELPSSTACLHKFTCFVGPDIPRLTSGSPLLVWLWELVLCSADGW